DTDEEIRSYYETNKEDFRRPAGAHLRHILIRLPEDATPAQEAEAQKKAAEVLKELKAGGDFAQLAQKYSDDPSAARGGDIGTIAKGQMLPEFEQVAFQIPVNEVAKRVRTRYGRHLI